MPRRPSLSCRQFRQLHAEYVDGYLCEERSQAMRFHGDACPACSRLDVSVRRSLLVLQTLPMIEPSADFRERLHERLELSQMTRRMPTRVPMRGIRWGVAGVVTAASVAFLLLAIPSRAPRPVEMRLAPVLARAPEPVSPARAAPMTMYASRPAETLRYEALPGMSGGRRTPSMLASPTVRLQLASFPGQ